MKKIIILSILSLFILKCQAQKIKICGLPTSTVSNTADFLIKEKSTCTDGTEKITVGDFISSYGINTYTATPLFRGVNTYTSNTSINNTGTQLFNPSSNYSVTAGGNIVQQSSGTMLFSPTGAFLLNGGNSITFTTSSTIWLNGTGLKISSGSPGADKVLTSDASGNATWQTLTAWGILGNSGTTAGTNFLGTTDAQDIVFKRNSIEDGRIGETSISFGQYHGTLGSHNVTLGFGTFSNNISGTNDICIGTGSGAANIIGSNDTYVGVNAGGASKGSYNIMLGFNAGLYGNYSNKLIIDANVRADSISQERKSLIVGTFGLDSSVQELRINGKIQISDGTQAAGKVSTSDVNGISAWKYPIQVYTAHTFTVSETYTVAAGTPMVINTSTISVANPILNLVTLTASATDQQLFSFCTASQVGLGNFSFVGAKFHAVDGTYVDATSSPVDIPTTLNMSSSNSITLIYSTQTTPNSWLVKQ